MENFTELAKSILLPTSLRRRFVWPKMQKYVEMCLIQDSVETEESVWFGEEERMNLRHCTNMI